jgi:apolipoprotein D and lipocalin family protein
VRAILAPCLALALFAPAAGADPAPVQPVAEVDLVRYSGKWYEIASFPMFFQRQCVGDTTAEYTLRQDGDVDVRNRCRTKDGFDEATARAWAVEGSGNARLKVQFFWPFRGDYWVIGLDPQYRWAVVGHPERKYLWILARTPKLSAAELEAALGVAGAQGFELGRLRYTVQGPAAGS